MLSVRGPGGYWFVFWTEPGWRTAYVVVSFVLFGWVLACLVWSLAGRPAGAARGAVCLGVVGATLLAVGAARRSGRPRGRDDQAWNDQLALLPWGMSRILGITVYLGHPDGAAVVPRRCSARCSTVGALAVGLPRRRATAPAAP